MIEELVGKHRITHGRTYALKFPLKHLRRGEALIRSIAPKILSDLRVKPLRSGLCQAVGHGLKEQVPIVVVFFLAFGGFAV